MLHIFNAKPFLSLEIIVSEVRSVEKQILICTATFYIFSTDLFQFQKRHNNG